MKSDINEGAYAVVWNGRFFSIEQWQGRKWYPIKSARTEKEADEIIKKLESTQGADR